ncbi:hypothetical protein JCM10449v2_000249 [Rhodotorula kratochvilovae]
MAAATAAEVLDLTLSNSDDELDAPAARTRPLPATARPPVRVASPPRRSPAQKPRDGPPSPSPPVPLPLLRPAAHEFDTPALKRKRSPEPATASKKTALFSSPSSVEIIPESPDASGSPRKTTAFGSTPLLDARLAALAASGALDELTAASFSALKDDSASLVDDSTASRSPVASSAPTSVDGDAADPSAASPTPIEVNPAASQPALVRPKPNRPRVKSTPPNQRLRLGALKCRVPPPPPPLPTSIAAATLPYLLSRSPRAFLVRPHSRFSLSARAASPELGVPAAPPTASGSRKRVRVGLVASAEDYWRGLLPDLSDQAHVGDDMAMNDEDLNERVWIPGREPAAHPFADIAPDLADRVFPPWQVVEGTSAQMLRDAALPDAYDRAEMDRHDARAAHDRAERRARRAERRRARAAAGKVADAAAEERRRRKKQRRSLRHETEAELQRRLRQLDRIDEEPDEESSDPDSDGAVEQPTVGFRALALQTQKAHRAKRIMRRAMGLDPDSETDDEGAAGAAEGGAEGAVEGAEGDAMEEEGAVAA